ncbi:MAG: hypothetical protein QGF78_06770 [Candidatus Bathyarchaeota archaeon]|nr:hypothetical protein [Candidatus Bathyarchaeota archaeon]|tara:strand:- start:51 stop:476 length:426 start_codon:yes stop_codon:yes gene_type:complete
MISSSWSSRKNYPYKIYIIKAKESAVEVREVQKAWGFSSPSLSSYHLNKLKDLGLVKSIGGDHSLMRKVRVGVLKQFISVGGLILSRYLFYAVLVTMMLATFLLQNPFILTERYRTTVIFGLVPLTTLGNETYRLWRDKPR